MISPFRPKKLFHARTGEPIERGGVISSRRTASPRQAKPQKPPKQLPEVGPPEITLANAMAWIQAETLTKLKGPVSLPVIEVRTAGCLSCPHRGQKRAKPDEIGYCLVCGCGDSERGRLSRKIAMRGVKRPKDCRWPEGDEGPQQ